MFGVSQSRVYSLSIWAPSNIIVGCPESDKDWKEELVILEGQWVQEGVPEYELPYMGFSTVPAWSKPVMENFDPILIWELQYIATLPIVERHCRVLMSLNSVAQCRFLKMEDFKWLEKSNYIPNREEATKTL